MRDPRIGWVITKDYLAGPGERTAVGINGPSGFRGSTKDLLKHGRAFRLLDDDGVVYYEGKWNGLEAGDEDAFGPLDDWGTPAAGCTTLQYYDHGWKTL